MLPAKNKYYVYVLYREDGTPFYVGKGHGKRWLAHEWNATPGRSHKDNIICSMQRRGLKVQRAKIRRGLSHDAACSLEIRTIAKLGRFPNGPLVNLTDGGEGQRRVFPEETRRKISQALKGRSPSPELRARIRATLLKKREAISAKAKEQWASNREGMLASLKKRPAHSAETRAKMGTKVQAAWDRGAFDARVKRIADRIMGRA